VSAGGERHGPGDERRRSSDERAAAAPSLVTEVARELERFAHKRLPGATVRWRKTEEGDYAVAIVLRRDDVHAHELRPLLERSRARPKPPMHVVEMMQAITCLLDQRRWVARVEWKKNERGEDVVGVIDPQVYRG
jgi:hypothetical protein